MYEMQMRVANMPANARYSESDRAETLSEPEGGTAEWTAEQSDSARDEKLEMPSESGTVELELPGGDESGTAEPEMRSENESDTAELEIPSENTELETPSGSGTAELELPGGDESSTAELELQSENESGTAELEMSSGNEWTTEQSDGARDEKSGARNLDGDRAKSPREPGSGTAEVGLPSIQESGTAELEMPSGSDTAELELPGGDESGTAEQ